MSSSVNYKDLYEEFLQLTSSPINSTNENQQPDPVPIIPIQINQPDTPDNSPLRALTPPSPISTSYSFPATTFLSLRLDANTEQEGGMSSTDFKMCDNSEVSTTPNTSVSVPTSGPGKHLPTESNSSSQSQSNGHYGQATYFQNLSSLPVVSSTVGGMQGVLQHNLSTIQHHNNMLMDSHQQHHVPIHHQGSSYANQQLQHQLMEGHNHHQAHQMNLSSQQPSNAHQFAHMQPLHPLHIPHPSIHSNSQTVLPFGMNFNSNLVGNGIQYMNNQMGTFTHNNQQQAHPHPLQQPTSCFLQHSCMHMQHQSLPALNNPRSPSTVGWMGSQTSSVSISHSIGNSAMSPGPTAKLTGPNPHSALSDTSTLPGGLEYLWKNVPIECQRIMTPQDIPDSARYRGYFTVCELLQLKRSLIMRVGFGGIPAPIRSLPAVLKHSTSTKKDKEEGKRGSKKGNHNTYSKIAAVTESRDEGYGNGQGDEKKQQLQTIINGNSDSEQRGEETGGGNHDSKVEDSTYGEQMIALDNIKSEEIVIHADMPPITGICVAGAVKDAMNTLTSDDNNTSVDDDADETEIENDNEDEEDGEDQDVKTESVTNNDESLDNNGLVDNSTGQCEARITGEELAMLPALPPISEILPKRRLPMEDSTNPTNETLATSTDDDIKKGEEEREKQLQLALVPFTGVTTSLSPFSGTSTVQINTSGPPASYYGHGPLENRSVVPPPPFRTSTLVLKLLQIGGYSIRSFSCTNPNRFRVLFNTHRMTYECQLPIIRNNPNPNGSLMRQVLTIDVGFEQIRMLKFGPDTLFMRVEGAPLLTLSCCPALEEPSTQMLSPIDQFLLEQIEKGQLKLSPCHQLYFLNERLVQQLESQFREHPRFRHLLIENEYGQQRSAQKRIRLF